MYPHESALSPKTFAGAVVEQVAGVDPGNWKTVTGLLITTLAIAGFSRQLLGDNIIGTIASLAIGMVSAFVLKDQINKAATGIEELIYPERFYQGTWSSGTNRKSNSHNEVPWVK